MGNITILIAAGIMAVALIILIMKQNEIEEQTIMQSLLKVLFIGLLVGVFLVIGKVAIDDANFCAWNPTNSTVSDTTTTYEYSYMCEENPNDTSNTFYKIVSWFSYIISIYLFFYLLKILYEAVKQILKTRINGGGKN